MIKEILLEKEEVVYKTLLNALRSNRLSQTILLSGTKNPLKLDTAYLIAQSIIEDKQDFACEECELCQRIKNNEYFDFILIDGSEETIKKEKIEDMYQRFKETSLERYNKKVFIINNINNASLKVLNMILKFIEEPKDNIYGILISDNLGSLLDTIKSRCQIIPFKDNSKDEIINLYLNDGFEDLDAYFLYQINHEYQKLDLNDELFLNAKDMVDISLDILDKPKLLAIEFNNRLYTYKDKNLKTIINMYISLMIVYLNDVFDIDNQSDCEYQNKLNKLSKYCIYDLLKIYMDAKDKLRFNYDKKLILDQLAYQISRVM